MQEGSSNLVAIENYADKLVKMRIKGLDNSKISNWHFEEMVSMSNLTKEEYILYEKGDNRLSVRDYQTVIQRIEDKMKEVEEETTVKHEVHTINKGDMKEIERLHNVKIYEYKPKLNEDTIKGDIEITLRVQIVEGTSLDKYRAGVYIQRIGWANNKEEVNGYIKKILLVSLRNEE